VPPPSSGPVRQINAGGLDTGYVEHRLIAGAGHNLPQQARRPSPRRSPASTRLAGDIRSWAG
jgi:hypothetical protein